MRTSELIEMAHSIDIAVDTIDREMSRGDIARLEFSELLNGGVEVTITRKDGIKEPAIVYRNLANAILSLARDISG